MSGVVENNLSLVANPLFCFINDTIDDPIPASNIIRLSDANLSKKELCLLIKTQIKDLEIFENNFDKDVDQRNYIVSNKKIENTGFKTQISINDGITELIKGLSINKKYNYGNI